jgi:integrase
VAVEGDHGSRDLGNTKPYGTGKLTRNVLPQANAYAMIRLRRRAAAAGIETKLGNHSFRATGITAYLKNGGNLDAQACSIRIYASARHQGDTRIVEDASATIEAERLRIARGEIGGQIVLRREKAYERRARAEQ